MDFGVQVYEWLESVRSQSVVEQRVTPTTDTDRLSATSTRRPSPLAIGDCRADRRLVVAIGRRYGDRCSDAYWVIIACRETINRG